MVSDVESFVYSSLIYDHKLSTATGIQLAACHALHIANGLAMRIIEHNNICP